MKINPIYKKIKYAGNYASKIALDELSNREVELSNVTIDTLYNTFDTIYNQFINSRYLDEDKDATYKEIYYNDLAPLATVNLDPARLTNTAYLDVLGLKIANAVDFCRLNVLPVVKNTVMGVNEELKKVNNKIVSIDRKLKKVTIPEIVLESFPYLPEVESNFDLTREVIFRLYDDVNILDILSERQTSAYGQKVANYLKGNYEAKFIQSVCNDLNLFTSKDIYDAGVLSNDKSLDQTVITYLLLLLLQLRDLKDVASDIKDNELRIYTKNISVSLFNELTSLTNLDSKENPIFVYRTYKDTMYVNENIYDLLETHNLTLDNVIGATLTNGLETGRIRLNQILSNLETIKSNYIAKINHLKIEADIENKKYLRLHLNNILLENVSKIPALKDDKEKLGKVIDHISKVVGNINIEILQDIEKFVASLILDIFSDHKVVKTVYLKIAKYYETLELKPKDSIAYVIFEIIIEHLFLQVHTVEV